MEGGLEIKDEEGSSRTPWAHHFVEDNSGPQQLPCIYCSSNFPNPIDLFISVSSDDD